MQSNRFQRSSITSNWFFVKLLSIQFSTKSVPRNQYTVWDFQARPILSWELQAMQTTVFWSWFIQ